jgi:hypothetical protein
MPEMWEEGSAGPSSEDEGVWLGRISARWGGISGDESRQIHGRRAARGELCSGRRRKKMSGNGREIHNARVKRDARC